MEIIRTYIKKTIKMTHWQIKIDLNKRNLLISKNQNYLINL